MRGLKDGTVGSDIGAGGHAKAAHKTGAQVADNVAIQIGQDQNIEVVGVLNQTHAGGVDDLVVELDIGIVGSHLASHAQEQAVSRLHDVGLVHGRHLFAAAAASILKGVLHNTAALGDGDGLDRDGGIRGEGFLTRALDKL